MWKYICASVVGTSHLDSGLPCQDDCYVNNFGENSSGIICVVADGAGSAINGGIGAELACLVCGSAIENTISEKDISSINNEDVIGWVKEIQASIKQLSESHELKVRDYACTLLGAVINKKNAIFFQIGDGSIVASSQDIQGVVFWPESGEYANMTYFVTDDNALCNLQISIVKTNISKVALFTDGLQRLALSFETMTPHLPFFEPMFRALIKANQTESEKLQYQLSEYLNSPVINERTDDDKTLVLACI